MALPKRRSWHTIILGIIIGIFVGIFFAASNVYAKDYSINSVNITAKVDSQGGVWITQQVKYNFSGYYNGIYFVQDTNGLGKMSHVSVKIYDQYPATLNASAKDGEIGQYKIEHNTNGDGDKSKGYERIKVYQPVSNQAFSVTYHYYLSQVAKRYTDTAEINWKMIGANWDRTIDRAQLKLVLPAGTNTKVKSWVHGSVDSTQKISRDNKNIEMNAKNVSNFMEAHVLFNQTAIPNATKIDKQRLHAALQRENKVLFYQNLKLKSFVVINFVTSNWIFAIILMLIGPLLAIRIVRKSNRQSQADTKPDHKGIGKSFDSSLQPRDVSQEKLHRFDVPDMEPTLASAWYLYEKKGEELDSLVFSTFVAEQQSKQSISLQVQNKYGYVIKKGINYQSEPFLDFILDTVGDGKQVSLAQIEKFGSKSDTKANKMAKKWQSFINSWKNKVTANGTVNPLFIQVDNKIRTVGMLWLFFAVLLPANLKLAVDGTLATSFWISLLLGFVISGLSIVIGAAACIGGSWLLGLFTKRQSTRFNSWLSSAPKFIVAVLMYLVSIVVTQVFFFITSHQLVLDFNLTLFALPLIFGTLAGLVLIMVVYVWFKHSYTPYTAKGYDLYLQVIQFKQMLHDIADFDRSKLPDQILWGEYLIYAIGLQEAKRLNRQLESAFGEQAVQKVMQDQLNSDNVNYLFYTDGMIGFNSSFGSSIVSGSTGPSSSAGGSSGGFGGGSGGGAF